MTRCVRCAALLACWAAGCGHEIDTTRHPEVRGTFGEEVHRILWKDLARRAPAEGAALGEERARFVRAVDGLMPAALLDDLQSWSQAMLPLYDQGRLQAVLRPGGCLLHDLADEGELWSALAFQRAPAGLGDDRLLVPLLERLGARPDLGPLLVELVELFLAHDGLDAAFAPSAEDPTFAALLDDLGGWLAAREAGAPDPASGYARLLDFLLEEDARLLDGGAEPHWLVRVDPRGRAWPALEPGTGALRAPFADRDLDGLADMDPGCQAYLGADGLPLALPPPFDAAGARPSLDGRLVWRYVDLRVTPLAALLDQLRPLVEDGVLWELPRSAEALLGPLAAQADDQGVYAGYHAADAPLVALTHLGVALADYDHLPELLDCVLALADSAEPALARLVHELENAGDVLDLYPSLSLRAQNRLLDDLVPRLQEASERGLLGPLLLSFGDPRWGRLEAGLADMIRYRDRLSDEDLVFREPTDWSRGDEDYASRSNLQRGVHLIHDTNLSVYSASIDLFGWWTIPDMLGFYIDSAAGDSSRGLAEVDWAVDVAVSEFSSTTPPAEEVNRFMVHDHSVLGNPRGNEGWELRAYNAEALLGMELSGALDGLRPAWTAFAARDRAEARTGTRVLAELMAVVHPHYSCRTPGASPACADVRPLEPMLLEVLDSTSALGALIDLLRVAHGLSSPQGHLVPAELDRFVGFLLRVDPALRRHDGATSVLGGDGVTPVFPLSRLYLLLDALRFTDEAADAAPASRAAWRRVAELAWEQLLEVEQDPASGEWRFRNRRAWFSLVDLLVFLRDRAAALRAEGALASRLAELEEDVRELVAGRVLPRVLDAWRLVADHPDLPPRLDGLVLELLDRGDPQRVVELRRLAAWALQHLQVERVGAPLARALGRRLDPQGLGWRWVPGAGCASVVHTEEPAAEDANHRRLPALRYLSEALGLARDLLGLEVPAASGGAPRAVTVELLVNALRPFPGRVASAAGPPVPVDALDDVLELVGRVHRVDPAETGPLSALDLAEVVRQVADYLLDEDRGLEKFYVLVERRDGFE